MNEEAAKKCWCPFARVPSNGLVGNRDNENDGLVTNFAESANCMGSGCMAWRWDIFASQGGYGIQRSSSEGYCGIAGKQP